MARDVGERGRPETFHAPLERHRSSGCFLLAFEGKKESLVAGEGGGAEDKTNDDGHHDFSEAEASHRLGFGGVETHKNEIPRAL